MKSNKRTYIFAGISLIALSFLTLILGSESISFADIMDSFSADKISNDRQLEGVVYIIQEIRIPRILTAIFSGIGLSVAGLLMQSYFRNALAGPYILGVSSGAGLGVALFLMAGVSFGMEVGSMFSGIVWFSILGSIGVLSIVLLFARIVGNGTMLLIIGLMIGSITSALVSVLQFFSGSEAIKKYLLWTMGSLTSVDKYELLLFIPFIIIGFIGALLLVNPLNALLLGDEQARSLGIEVKKIKTVTIIITGLLAGTVTAFCGPVAFIGLAAPHIAKIISKTSNHRVLLPLTALIGANILLFSDLVSQLPGFDTMLPINAVTSLIGAPIVIYIIIRDRKLKYD